MYRFDFVLAAYKYMNMGAVHSVEIPFALNTINKGYFGARALQGTPPEQVGAIRDQMNGAWLNFIKTGNPEGGTISWEKYDMKNTIAHVFDITPSNQPLSIDKNVLAAWEKIGILYDEE
jgi:para-nitrobenzyl esterase